MSKLFASRLLLTSDSDLLFYLEKHPSLYKLVGNGDHIVSYDKLEMIQTITEPESLEESEMLDKIPFYSWTEQEIKERTTRFRSENWWCVIL